MTWNKTLRMIVIVGLALPLTMCTNQKSGDVVEKKLDDVIQRQNVLVSRLESLEKSQKEILSNITSISKAVNEVKNQTKNIAQQNPSKNNNKPSASKVHNIEIGNSVVLGPPDAKVTITEWMDFQ